MTGPFVMTPLEEHLVLVHEIKSEFIAALRQTAADRAGAVVKASHDLLHEMSGTYDEFYPRDEGTPDGA